MPKVLSDRDFERVSAVVRAVEGETRPATPPGTAGPASPQPVSLTFRNDATTAAPAWGVMAVTGAGYSAALGPYLIVGKPSSTYARLYVVNDCLSVAAGKYGQCFVSGWCRVLYDTGTPAVGELWGPDNAKWGLVKGADGTSGSGTTLRADWGVVVAGIADSTGKVLVGRIVPYGRARRCTAQLAAAATPGASVNVDTIVVIDDGWCPVASASATLSATMPADASALDNAPCIIEWNDATDAWIIVWVHQRAKMISGTLGGALTTTTASQTISSPVSMDGGQVPSGTLTGYNIYTTAGFAGDSGGRCVAAWNEGTDHYEFIDVECPA